MSLPSLCCIELIGHDNHLMCAGNSGTMDGGLPALWEALRAHGLQSMAPMLVQHGVRQLKDIHARSGVP